MIIEMHLRDMVFLLHPNIEYYNDVANRVIVTPELGPTIPSSSDFESDHQVRHRDLTKTTTRETLWLSRRQSSMATVLIRSIVR